MVYSLQYCCVNANDLIAQRNVFGESAWTFDVDRQQYYYHAFSEDEPDLNLTNPTVIDELDVSFLLMFCGLNLSLIHI